MLQRLFHLIIKELQALLGTRQGRVMIIVPVILQTLIFPFAATLEVKNNTLLVYNQDMGLASHELIERLAQTASFTTVITTHSAKELADSITNQKALLAVQFAPDFSRRLSLHQTAVVQIVMDGRRSNSGQIASEYVSQVINTYVGEHSGVPATTLVTRNLYNQNLDFKWHVLPSLVAIITSIGCLMVTALSVAREREEDTFSQLLVSPLTPAYIMAGKAIPGVLVAMLQGSFIASVAHWAYGVPFTGSVIMLLIGMLCYGFALAGVGLFISSISQTQQQAFFGGFAFLVPAVILSGYPSPIENMPVVFQWITMVNPLSYFIPLLKGVFLKNYLWHDVWPRLWPMLAIAIFTLTVALRMFRRHIA